MISVYLLLDWEVFYLCNMRGIGVRGETFDGN